MNKALNFFSLVTLAAGLALTVYGLGHLSLQTGLPGWSNLGLIRYFIFIISAFFALFVGAHVTAKNPLLIALIYAVTLAIFSNGIWALATVICIGVSTAITGHAILLTLSRGTMCGRLLLNILVGLGSVGTIIGLIAHIPISYPGLYGLIVALPIFLGRKWLFGILKANSLEADYFSCANGKQNFLLDASIGTLALVYFSIALVPEIAHDALAMHLFVPAQLAERHQWGFDASTYVWAVMPMLGDWIFALPYMLGGEPATRLLNVAFIFLVGCLIRQLVEWAGGSHRASGLAFLMYLSTPLTFTEGSSLFVESIWAAFLIGGTLEILLAAEDRAPWQTHLVSGGLLLGCALATKAITLPVLPVLALAFLVRFRAWRYPNVLASAALGLCLLIALGAIPYLTAWYLTGNPVFPFMNKVFQSPLYPPVNFDSSAVFGKGLSWDVLYRSVFQSEKYLEAQPGAPGFQYLTLLVPALLVLARAKQVRSLLLALIAFASITITFQSVSYLRYVFPALAVLIAAIGVAFSAQITNNSPLHKSLLAGAALAILLNLAFIVGGSRYGDFPLHTLWSGDNSKTYLLERQPTRLAVELINRLNTERSPVAVFAQPMTAGLSGDGLYPSWYNIGFQKLVESADTAESLASVLMDRGVEYLIVDHVGVSPTQLKLIETATDKIAAFNNITVRKIGKAFSFRRELLTNPKFSSIEGWTLAGGASFDGTSASITVSVDTPAFQAVAVTPKRKYVNEVTARCKGSPAQGRVQVNWASPSKPFIGTEIHVFNCSESWAEHSIEMVPPPEASTAVVYATGHSITPIEIMGVSFRQ